MEGSIPNQFKNKKRPEKRKSTFSEADEKLAREVPHTIVFSRGALGASLQQLMKELREMLLPYTAQRLQSTRNNRVRDFVRIAGHFGVKKFVVLTNSTEGPRLRIAGIPAGPTVYFTIESYGQRPDVFADSRVSSRFKGTPTPASLLFPAVPILNNFVNCPDEHWQTCATVLQSLFPTLRLDTIKVAQCQRVVLFNRRPDTDLIDVRHFLVKTSASGLSRVVRKLKRKKLKSGSGLTRRLQRLKDVHELFENEGSYFSDSEAELEEVTLPQAFQKNSAGSQVKIRLVELGPRLTLKMVKIEAGFMGGETLWHHDPAVREAPHKHSGSKQQARSWIHYFREGWENPKKAAARKAKEAKKAKEEGGAPEEAAEEDWDADAYAGAEDGEDEEEPDDEPAAGKYAAQYHRGGGEAEEDDDWGEEEDEGDDDDNGENINFGPVRPASEVLRKAPQQQKRKVTKEDFAHLREQKRRRILQDAGKI